jgi:putative transposase
MQFMTMAMAELADRNSFRDIVENISAQAHRLYHLGIVKLSRFNLSRINDVKPHERYEGVICKLLHHCQGVVPGYNFRFTNPLYSLYASTIDLCLSIFPWANYLTTKRALLLHAGLNHSGYLPEFVTVIEGK